MLKKITKKIVCIFILIIIFFTLINSCRAAWGDQAINIITEEHDDLTNTSNTARKVLGNIAIVTRIVGVTVGMVMLMAIGMKYMAAAPGEKADLKKSLIPYVVGAVIVFAASGIVSIIIGFSAQIN